MKVFIEEQMRLTFEEIVMVVDSEIVRAMVCKESYGFNTFVGVRIGEIQEATSQDQWFWVDSKNNVADLITRGCSPIDIGQNSIWQVGKIF